MTAGAKQHVWKSVDLSTRSGKQLFFCLECGTLSPAPDKAACGTPAFWAYETWPAREKAEVRPLPAAEVISRLHAALPRDP